MKSQRLIGSNLLSLALVPFGVLSLSSPSSHAEPVSPSLPAPVAVPATPPGFHVAASPRVVVPAVEPDGATSSGAGPSPFASKAAAVTPAAGQSLTAPVTINANISADALTVTQAGKGRAITGSLTNTSNTFSAIKGITAGSGGGVNGVNSGTLGPAGRFQITASGSTQPVIASTTAGTGNAVQGVISSTAENDTPAVLGQHLSGPSYSGIGVEGDGNLVGVKGVSDNYYGVMGVSNNGGSGVYGSANGTGTGVQGASGSGSAVYGYSAAGSGIYGGSGTNGYAGYFHGRVYVTGTITAQNYASISDRAVKQDFHDIDGNELLQRIEAMPIGGWDYQVTPGVHHVGPMAQDFRAAFGLGTDDKHIDIVDGIGVSLAAIKALQRQLQQRDAQVVAQAARIEALESQALAQRDATDARIAALENAAAAVAGATARP